MSENKAVLHGSIFDLPEAPGNFMENVQKKVVFGPTRFWPDYVMRCWIVPPGAGETTPHSHPWPHWVVVLSGESCCFCDGETFTCKAGDWQHVPSDADHYFYNSSATEELVTLCIVPPQGDVNITNRGC